MKYFFTIYIFLLSQLFAQNFSLEGNIEDRKTERPIPFVNIGVEGTYFGTSSNEFGNFKLVLKKGTHNLIISCVGYKTKTLKISIPQKYKLSIKLNPVSIELPEIIVDADENPAYRIIRNAIANKEKNKAGLKNYHYNFYSKNILNSGKEIVFIEEDIGEGFKILPDSVKELKTQLSKTENIEKSFFQNSDLNFFEKAIIDFTDDSLTMGEFVFHLPISKDAFDYYDYKLLGVKQSNSKTFYQIEVIPYSKIRPTFSGEILIEDSAYALTGIDLTLENRNLLPFTEFKMSIIQNLLFYKNYWFPKYYNIDVETNMNYYHLIKLDSAITSFVKVFNNISINLEESDPLLKKVNQIGDTTLNLEPKLISKLEMDSLRLYPLVLSETEAYGEIDSSKTIVSSLKLGGVGGEYIKSNIENEENNNDSSSGIYSLLQYLDFQNNRVDGITPGLKFSYWLNDTLLNINTSNRYSFERKDVESSLGFHIPFNNSLIDAIDLKANYGTKPIGRFSPYSELFNGISVTLGFEDQYNYYFSRGIKLNTTKNVTGNSTIKLNFNIESQKTISEKKYHNIFYRNRTIRKNLEITNGIDNRVGVEYSVGSSPYDYDLTTSDGFISSVEFSNKSFGSDFDYVKINLSGQFYITTLFTELFFSPYLAIHFEANSVLGDYGPQHLVTPQTALGYFSPFGTFKGLSPYHYLGNNSFAIHFEHNWKKTFFDMLGIYFPVAWNIELTTGINGLGIWNDSNFFENKYSDEYYWEVYGGISGILGFLNINVAYNKLHNTVVRFGFSKFF